MSIISDNIEKFIRELFDDQSNYVDIQRNELAEHFHCVPSQINYVLSTRFTLERGYLIESRRGGGGYVRIVRMDQDKDDYLLELLTEGIGEEIDEKKACHIVDALLDKEIVHPKEAGIMKAVLSKDAISLPEGLKKKVRAQLLKVMLIAVINV